MQSWGISRYCPDVARNPANIYSKKNINWQKAVRESTVHSLVSCDDFEGCSSICGGTMEAFDMYVSGHQELIQSLQSVEQLFFSDQSNQTGK